jgi:DNA modification methylase
LIAQYFGPDEGLTLYHGDCLDVLPTLEPVDAVVTDPPYGLEFMGKAWDHGVPGVPYWAAVRDALKPGGHLLAFGGTRTHHRLMVGIEDAGFEIRDVIMWVYGSGFPKSHDVSISLDKNAGAMGHRGRAHYAYATGKDFQGRDMSVPQSMSRHVPITDAAKQWDGWGTALKPAWEPIIVARKPLEGTMAQNVLAHGVGGINIGGCRVGTDSITTHMPSYGYQKSGVRWDKRPKSEEVLIGRWPANLIHDGSDEVTRLMPDDAARFFYCAKAAQADRNEGVEGLNTHPTVKPLALMRYLVRLVTPPGGVVCDPFMGSGSTGKAADLEGCQFIGIDSDESSCELASKRRQLQRVLPMV